MSSTEGAERTPGLPVALLFATAAEVPAHDSWLGLGERGDLARFAIAKRRSEWRLGRWTAKRAVALHLGCDPAEVEIRAAPDGCPEAFAGESPLQVSISLSHRDGRALCAVVDGRRALGCDLELIEGRAEVFVTDYFTAAEATAVRTAAPGDRAALVTTIWSAKESALKALREGLRADTRSVEVSDARPPAPGWFPIAVADRRGGGAFAGWVRRDGRHVVTVVTDRPTPPPRELWS